MSDKALYLTETLNFSAAHYYFKPELSADENFRLFGRCSQDHGHGHDYKLEIEIRSHLEGFEEDREHLLDLLRRLDLELDHRHLNHYVSRFRDGGDIPTTENISLFIRERLLELSPGLSLYKLRLFERPDLWVEIES